MNKIIEEKLKQLELIYQSFQLSSFHSFVAREIPNSKIARIQLQKAARLLRDTKTLLLALEAKPLPDPVLMSLLEATLVEIQECLQKIQPPSPENNPASLSPTERHCASEAVFSGMLALQLFLAP